MISNLSATATATTDTMSTKPLKTWIDERPFETIINDISLPPRTQIDKDFGCLLPASKFDYVADMIYRDPNIFRSDSTLYDNDVWTLEAKVTPLEKEFKKITKDLELVGTAIENEKNTKKLEELKQSLHELILKEREVAIEKRRVSEHLTYYKAVQEIYQKEFTTLNRIAKIYKLNGDKEFVRKGAHWACSQAHALIAKIKVPEGVRPVSTH